MAAVMESSYSIDRQANLIRLQVWGELNAESLIELLERAGQDPDYVPGMNAIGDYRHAHGQWDYCEIQRLRDFMMHIAVPGEVRWAAVMRPGDLAAAGHLLILISEAVGGHIRMKIFEEPAEALRWVRREDDPVARHCQHAFLNGRVKVLTGDITAMPVDAVVNAANSTLLGGGGVDGAIHRSGGPAILQACQALRSERYRDGLPAGEAVLTTAGRLPARHVIHTVGPIWGRDPQPDALLASCYRRAIAIAARHELHTLAFPAISTGAYGYPKAEAAAVASQAIADALTKADSVREVSLVFFSDVDRDLFLSHQRF